MTLFFMALGGLFALATLASLLVGVTAMGKGGEFNKRHGNKLMRYRVLFQGLAIACFLIALLAR